LKTVRIPRLSIAVSLSFALMSCTTTPAQLAANPKQVPKVNLCRTYLQTPDPMFQQQLAAELAQRGVSPFECHEMVQKQDQAAAALVAVALVGTAVAVCAKQYVLSATADLYRKLLKLLGPRCPGTPMWQSRCIGSAGRI
jgi:hypothetical protein